MRKIYQLFVIVLVIYLFSSPCYASDFSFELDDIDTSDATNAFNSLKLTAINDPEFDDNFSCFGVSENGNFALAFKRGNNGYVLIYDHLGAFITGFKIFNYGSFYIELFDSSFVIYTVRGSNAYTVTYGGECVSVKKILDTTYNNEYWRKLQANRHVVGENEYVAEALGFNSNLFAGGTYSKLLKITPEGESIVLYEASVMGQILTIAPIIFSIIFVVILCPLVGVLIIKKALKNRKKDDQIQLT